MSTIKGQEPRCLAGNCQRGVLAGLFCTLHRAEEQQYGRWVFAHLSELEQRRRFVVADPERGYRMALRSVWT